MILSYNAIISKQDDSYYFAQIPGTDCQTSGKTLEEAKEMIEDALGLWLLVQEDENLPMPEFMSEEEIRSMMQINPHDVICIIEVDTAKAREESDKMERVLCERRRLMRSMHDIVMSMSDESGYFKWIQIVPDGASDEDLNDVAEDDELFNDSIRCFEQIVSQYLRHGLCVCGHAYGYRK